MVIKKRSWLFFVLLVVSFFLPASVIFAKIGVGMGAGEIRLTEAVKPGGIYKLPNLRVFNTGDEVTVYGMGVAYHQDNPELRPRQSWFSFSPATFTIEPGKSQITPFCCSLGLFYLHILPKNIS